MHSGDLPRCWTITHRARPWTTNAERAGNRWDRAALTREWREAFYLLARAQRIPRLDAITVTVIPVQARGVLADTAACNPAVKAAIDGLVDAHIIDNDSGVYVKEIRFLAPRRGPDSLTLTITEVPL